MVIGKSPTPLACPALIANPAARCASGTYWEEALLHVAMSGVSAFGFWGTTGYDTAQTDGRLSDVLRELDRMVGAADRTPVNLTVVYWMVDDTLVMSSMAMSASEAAAAAFLSEREEEEEGGVIVHRAVCLGQGSELSRVEIGGGVRLSCGNDSATPYRVVPRSRIVTVPSPVSPMGVWVLQHSPWH